MQVLDMARAECTVQHKWFKETIAETKEEKQQQWRRCEGGWTLEQVAHRSYGLCILGHLQSPTGHSSGQTDLADPA